MLSFLRQCAAATRLLVVLTVVLGVAYPLAVYGVGRLVPGRADGSMLTVDGKVVGSTLIGQPFSGDEWFLPRPSAAGTGYDPLSSGASNLGPNSPDLLATVEQRRHDVATREGVAESQVPPDAVTASASGLDPDISPAYAALQVPRVARTRGLDEATVRGLVADATTGRELGFLGEPRVNVLRLNASLAALGHSELSRAGAKLTASRDLSRAERWPERRQPRSPARRQWAYSYGHQVGSRDEHVESGQVLGGACDDAGAPLRRGGQHPRLGQPPGNSPGRDVPGGGQLVASNSQQEGVERRVGERRRCHRPLGDVVGVGQSAQVVAGLQHHPQRPHRVAVGLADRVSSVTGGHPAPRLPRGVLGSRGTGQPVHLALADPELGGHLALSTPLAQPRGNQRPRRPARPVLGASILVILLRQGQHDDLL